MPSVSARQHRFFEAAAHNRAFAKKVGVPQKVAKDFAAADKASGKFKRKAKTMAKKSDGMPKGMGGEMGMSPRKAMAHGDVQEADTGSGGFGVKSFADANGHTGEHPDHTMGTGHMGAMPNHERAIGEPIHHTKHHHPAQAAPKHGPHHVDGYQDNHAEGHKMDHAMRHEHHKAMAGHHEEAARHHRHHK